MIHLLFLRMRFRCGCVRRVWDTRRFWAILAVFLSACAMGPEIHDPSPFTLTLLHTNDVHGEYSGRDIHGRDCDAAICEGGIGGILRLNQTVSALRRDFSASLLLDAGDAFQGTPLFILHRESIVTDLMNTLEYDAMVPGNHEFDDGCDPFFNLVRDLRTPVVAANLSFADDMDQAPGFYPWIVVTRENHRIGIIGLTHPDTPEVASPCAEAKFSDPATTLRRAVAELTDQGVTIIIALTHLGLDADLSLARRVAGVDVIVGGHSHSLLSNEAPDAAGPYPIVAAAPDGNPVLVVTAGSRLVRLGKLDVTFDASGRPIRWQGEPMLLNDRTLAALEALPPDPALVRKMMNYTEPVCNLRKTVIGRIVRENPGEGPMERAWVCRYQECLTGNIVADALLDFLKPDVQAVLINGGGMRGVFPDGAVTERDLLSVLPFDNTLATTHMPGHVLLAMLEHGLSGYENKKGRFLMPAGLRYAFDPGLPAGKRLLSATIQDENGKWHPVEPDHVYAVGTLSYLAEGGDGYDFLTHLAWKNTGVLARDRVKNYIIRRSPLFPCLEDRIVRVESGSEKDGHVRHQAFPR